MHFHTWTPTCILENNIKIDSKETGYENVYYIHKRHDRDQWRLFSTR